MSLPSEIIPVGLLATPAAAGGAAAYTIEKSLRFNSGDSAYLSRTPSSAGNRKTFTWSGWVKRSKFGERFRLIAAGPDNNNRFLFGFGTDDKLEIFSNTSGATRANIKSNAVFRDPSAWYHVVLKYDASNTTAAIYVNGVNQDLTVTTAVANVDQSVNSTSAHYIGRTVDGTLYSNGYLADIHFIDGQALDPTSFGEFDANNNWQPIEYTGTYGTNGFHLNFSDATSTTTIAEDSSGNNNDWTANNFVVSATSAPSTVCGEVTEGGNLTLTAPTGYTFTSVTFASYGTPSGSCPSFTQGGCHASNSQSIVEGYLIGNSTATIPATNAVFGDPCGGTGKKLAVVAVATFDGSSNDSLFDSPTNSGTDTGAGGELSGNYCTWNPLTGNTYTASYKNGNLDFDSSVGADGLHVFSTFQLPSTGKWYWESVWSTGAGFFGINSNATRGNNTQLSTMKVYNPNGQIGGVAGSATWTTGDVISAAYDADAGVLQFYKNGALQPISISNVGYSNGPWWAQIRQDRNIVSHTNFGQRPFAYDITTTISQATGAIPILSTSDDYGQTLSSGTASDSNSSSLVLALPMNGTNGGTTFTDYSATIKGSGSAKTITVNGNTQTSTTASKWYGSSAYFDGSGDYLTSTSSDYAFGTGDLTVEGWAYIISHQNYRTMATTRPSNSGYADAWHLGVNANGSIILYSNTFNLQSANNAVPAGTWFHWAFTRSSGTARLFVNGTVVASGSVTNNYAQTALGIGDFPSSQSEPMYGYMADLRIYKGTAKYTAAFTPPSSALFKALCTQNLDEPTIADGSTAMDVALWNGNSSTQNITGLAFSPDLAWVKGRVGTLNHVLSDTIRGANLKLASNTTAAEAGTDNGTISAFNSDGISVAMGTGTYAGYETNLSGYSYVGWFWDGGSSTVSNTEGSITSSVRANATAGFSVITATTPSQTTNYSCGHGLGVAPEFYIWKFRNVTSNWVVYHKSIAPYTLKLDSTAVQYTGFNMPAPSSSVINLLDSPTAAWNSPFVIYAFAPVEGYSAFGSYTGNGSSDGPFVYTGFRPRFILIKATNATPSWRIFDTERDSYNLVTKKLYPNLTNAELDNGVENFDILSNGFKHRDADGGVNGSGTNYIWAAFAEHPFRTSRAR